MRADSITFAVGAAVAILTQGAGLGRPCLGMPSCTVLKHPICPNAGARRDDSLAYIKVLEMIPRALQQQIQAAHLPALLWLLNPVQLRKSQYIWRYIILSSS